MEKFSMCLIYSEGTHIYTENTYLLLGNDKLGNLPNKVITILHIQEYIHLV